LFADVKEEAKRQAEQVTVERMDHRIGRTRTKESNSFVCLKETRQEKKSSKSESLSSIFVRLSSGKIRIEVASNDISFAQRNNIIIFDFNISHKERVVSGMFTNDYESPSHSYNHQTVLSDQ